MNTPAHVIASCVLIPHKPGWPATSALVVGALLPDMPMFGFYAYQKFLRGRTEAEIWSENPEAPGLYFDPAWQLFFDWFNSLPLVALVMLLCWWLGQDADGGAAAAWRWGLLCAASAGLHQLCDLPLHHNDAHRHFLPLTDWRFASPVSYWDPNHFGRVALPVELLLTIAGCVWLLGAGRPSASRWVGGVTLGLYAVLIVFAAVVWSGLFARRTADPTTEPAAPRATHPAATETTPETSSSETP